MPHKTGTNTTYDSGDFAHVMDECLKLADWDGLRQARRRVEEERQAARPRPLLFPRRGVDLQRPHGAALRSERHGDDRRRHPFARPGPRHRLCADGVGMARRAVRATSASCRATPTPCRSAAAPTARAACMVGGNALKSAADAIIDKAKPMAAHLMEAAAGDIEFKDGRFGDRRHRPLDGAHRRGQGVLPAGAPAARSSRSGSRPRARSPASRRTIRTAATSARSRSIPTDRRGRGRALSRGRRRRPGDEPPAVRGPGPRRRGAGRRPGADGGGALRRQRPARHRQLPGLLHAARRRPAGHRVGADRSAVDHQSARRQGGGRGRLHRRAAGGDRRDPRCAAAARRRAHRHAGDAEPGLAAIQRAKVARVSTESHARAVAQTSHGRRTLPSSAPDLPG